MIKILFRSLDGLEKIEEFDYTLENFPLEMMRPFYASKAIPFSENSRNVEALQNVKEVNAPRFRNYKLSGNIEDMPVFEEYE